MQCMGFGPPLMARVKSRGFSRVAAGTWGILSSYNGDAHSKREFVELSQDTCLGRTDTSGN